jgi:hypothetical protein
MGTASTVLSSWVVDPVFYLFEWIQVPFALLSSLF